VRVIPRDLAERLADLVCEYGFDTVQKAMENIEDGLKERSCSDDRPIRAANE